jgi:hypothetical protein
MKLLLFILLTTPILCETAAPATRANRSFESPDEEVDNYFPRPRPNFSVGGIYLYELYKEPGYMDVTGSLFGFSAQGTYYMNESAILSGEVDYAYGPLKYDGATQEGTPISYDLNGSINNWRGLARLWYPVSRTFYAMWSGGLGLRFLSTEKGGYAGGYRREINYTYLPLQFEFGQNLRRFSWSVFAEYDFFMGGTVNSHVSDATDELPDFENSQSEGSGYRFGSHIKWNLHSFAISVDPYIQLWRIGASDRAYGGGQVFIEPDNETTIFALAVHIAF